MIATSMAGATPFLIEDGVNGYIFRSGDAGSLADKLAACLKDRERAKDMAYKAYSLMQKSWNPKIAAERVIAVSERLLSGESFFYEDGPMSRAPIMYENWYS